MHTAEMGQMLAAPRGTTIEVSAHVTGSRDSQLRLLVDGVQPVTISPLPITSSDQTVSTTWQSDGQQHWLRADVISSSGKLQLLGNPVYVNFPGSTAQESSK
jgi:hypothetical protein